MTNDNTLPIPPGGPQAVQKKLQAENDALHVEHKVELINGPAKGTVLSIPDGVQTLDVEVDGVKYQYLRSARSDNTFQIYGG